MQFILLLAILAVDQIVKNIVSKGMLQGESIPIIQDVFHITYVQNTGAAFSIMSSKTVLLTAFTGIVILGLLIYMIKMYSHMDKTLRTCYAMIIAGGAGNLIDRIVRGFVVDMFDFRIWPVFNVADIAICVGCALLIIYVAFIEPRKKNHDK